MSTPVAGERWAYKNAPEVQFLIEAVTDGFVYYRMNWPEDRVAWIEA